MVQIAFPFFNCQSCRRLPQYWGPTHFMSGQCSQLLLKSVFTELLFSPSRSNGNAEVESPGTNAPRAIVLIYFLRCISFFYWCCVSKWSVLTLVCISTQ